MHGGAWFPHHDPGNMSGRAGVTCADAPAMGTARGTARPTSVARAAVTMAMRFVTGQSCPNDRELDQRLTSQPEIYFLSTRSSYPTVVYTADQRRRWPRFVITSTEP